METSGKPALQRLADFEAKHTLESAEGAELVALLIAVSPGEVQRLQRQWRRRWRRLVASWLVIGSFPQSGSECSR